MSSIVLNVGRRRLVNLGDPAGCIVPSAHGPVLTVLARSGQPLTGRRIAELTTPKVSQRRTAQVLQELAVAGIVDRMPAGAGYLFTLNRDHVAAPAVDSIANLTQALWDRIADHARTWTHPPRVLLVFGSAARGDGTLDSDIDLLVVRPTEVSADDDRWHADLTALTRAVMRWSGNSCDVLDRSPDELTRMAQDGERVLDEIRRDGRALIGSRAEVPVPVRVA